MNCSKDEKFPAEEKYYWIGKDRDFTMRGVCTDTLQHAIEYARLDQPNDRPFYIVRAVTQFEIVGVVNKRGKFCEQVQSG